MSAFSQSLFLSAIITMSDGAHSDASNGSHISQDSHTSQHSHTESNLESRQSQADQLARDRIAKILANRSSVATSIYTNKIQGSPEDYNYGDRAETKSPIGDDSDDNWQETPPAPPLPLTNPPKMGVSLKNLRRWCALTHSQWRDKQDRVLSYHCVQEAHVVNRALSRKEVCNVFLVDLVPHADIEDISSPGLRKLDWKWHGGSSRENFLLTGHSIPFLVSSPVPLSPNPVTHTCYSESGLARSI